MMGEGAAEWQIGVSTSVSCFDISPVTNYITGRTRQNAGFVRAPYHVHGFDRLFEDLENDQGFVFSYAESLIAEVRVVTNHYAGLRMQGLIFFPGAHTKSVLYARCKDHLLIWLTTKSFYVVVVENQ